MMKPLRITSLLMLLVLFATTFSFAQDYQQVTIRDLNTYETLQTQADISTHPLNGVPVEFTAVIVSYPKSSGLASFNEGTGLISRIHVFVTDTNAVLLGKEGMSIQIVENDTVLYKTLENTNIGSVVTVRGDLGFFGTTAQFDAEEIIDITGDVDQQRFIDVFTPRVVNVADLNQINGDGTMELNLANYPSYANSYVRLEGVTVTNVSEGDRPNFAFKQGDNLIYFYDTSLRFRNDRDQYRAGYNFRRTEEDGEFQPPPAGTLVNVQGFLTLNGDNPDGLNADGQNSFTINLWDDGVLWLNGVRNVSGENGFFWPNDLEIVGFPPSFENLSISNQTPTSSEDVTLSVDVFANGEGATLTSVRVAYTAALLDQSSVSDTVDMAVSGNTYTYTFPKFSDKATVTYQVLAEDSNGLLGETPAASFIILDDPVNSISVIQRTSDELQGPSPLFEIGKLPMNIQATVVSDSADGMIVIHDAAAAWSGIFLDSRSAGVTGLKRGDLITIDSAVVDENFGVTYLTDINMTYNSGGADYEALIPSILTQDITSSPDRGEAYEGMIARFEDVKITTSQADGGNDFGEFAFGSRQGGGEADTLDTNEGFRVDDGSPSPFGTSASAIGGSFNENVKPGAILESVTGAVWFSFGNPKMKVRSLDDFVSDDWTFPVRTISLISPDNDAAVEVVTDPLNIEWTSSFDADGDTVRYLFSLSTPDTATTIFETRSANDGLSPFVELPAQAVKDLLAANGLENGDDIDLIWTVKLVDSRDTVVTSTYSAPEFTEVWYSINLTLGVDVSNEDILPVAYRFELNQNYPNPFNPSTQISFSVPEAGNVELTVFNMLGQRVAVLVNKQMSAGTHQATFDATSLSSGVYFYQLRAGNNVSTKKMLLIK